MMYSIVLHSKPTDNAERHSYLPKRDIEAYSVTSQDVNPFTSIGYRPFTTPLPGYQQHSFTL